MAKHVYLCRRSVVLGITCRKMALNITPLSRSEKRRERDYERRKDSFGMEYVQTKYPKIYDETVDFYNNLRKEYPQKYDLWKTEEFKQWKRKQGKGGQQTTGTTDTPKPQVPKPPPSDGMQLRIPLWDTATLTSAQSLETVTMESIGGRANLPVLTRRNSK